MFHTSQHEKQYYMEKHPSSLPMLLGKLFVFAFTWGFGGTFQRQDEMDEDLGVASRRNNDGKEHVNVDIASEFDNFMHDLFEVEPPIGEKWNFSKCCMIVV